MSYRVQRTVYRLVFNDTDHEGIEIRARAMSFGERMHVAYDLAPNPADTMEDRKTKMDEQHRLFVEHLVDWNLVEEDDAETPIPTTLEGLHSLEPEFVGTIIGVWQMGRAAIPAPLGSGSTSGVASAQVESTLTGIPSESLAS